MLFYGDHTHIELSKSLAKALKTRAHFPQIHLFSDGEKRVKLLGKIPGESVIILKSFTPNIDSSIIEINLIIDAAKKSGTEKITLIAPYLPYQRGERVFEPGEGIPLSVVSRLLECTGLDTLVTIDPHVSNLPDFFSIPVITCSTTQIFANEINSLHKKNSPLSIISPDQGGETKVTELQKLVDASYAVVLKKKRNHQTGHVTIQSHSGTIHEQCVLVDDMITTGNTILEATNYLVSQGAKKITVMATHPVFSGDMNALFSHRSINKIYVTDSIYFTLTSRKLKVLSISSSVIAHI